MLCVPGCRTRQALFPPEPKAESLRLVDFALQAPDIHVYPHPQGPLLEGRTALRHDASGMSVEMHGFGEVGGSVGGGGIVVNEIPPGGGLTASPRLGLSAGTPGLGFDVGLGLGYHFNDVIGVSANFGVMDNHPLAESTGRLTGFSGDLGLRLSL